MQVRWSSIRIRLWEEGFPHLFLCEARGEHHGLAIELKRNKGRATPDQKQ